MHVRRRARFQQHRDASCHQVFFLQGKAPKEIHAILTETLGEHAPSYATVYYNPAYCYMFQFTGYHNQGTNIK